MASSGNFCTWNPLRVNRQTQTFAEGNTRFSSTQTSTNPAVTGTFGVTSGKWYWELKDLTSSPDGSLLFYDQSISSGSHPGYGFVLNTKKKEANKNTIKNKNKKINNNNLKKDPNSPFAVLEKLL